MAKDVAQAFEEIGLKHAFEELLREMSEIGEIAPDGQVLDQMEGLVLGRGRELLRQTLEAKLQAAIDSAEKKGRRPVRNAKRKRETKGAENDRS